MLIVVIFKRVEVNEQTKSKHGYAETDRWSPIEPTWASLRWDRDLAGGTGVNSIPSQQHRNEQPENPLHYLNSLTETSPRHMRALAGRKGQRREPATDDAEFVPDANGWPRFVAPPCSRP